jgi:formylglycine-generating enzyme required for sulfatase activity
MITVPAGYFIMGSPPDEPGRSNDEGPRHEVIIPEPFTIGKYPVTRREFAAFMAEGKYKIRGTATRWYAEQNKWEPAQNCSWLNPGFTQDEDHPVVCVNYDDAQAYVKWLNEKVNANLYRLPTEAEWEYACRAGTTMPHYWGRHTTSSNANFNGSDEPEGVYHKQTVPVHYYQPNDWGLYQMLGNVWEYCEDSWNEKAFEQKPHALNRCGGAFRSEKGDEYVIRGGSWHSNRASLRSANRARASRSTRYSDRSFRVVRKFPS